ncbi:MAG: phosphodiester glycosidase family protein [bacterium]|nr:phosphodiester glycosidase family protein [bacterium]
MRVQLKPASLIVLLLTILAISPVPAEGERPGRNGWLNLEPGLAFGSFTSPRHDEVEIKVLRIDPAHFDLQLLNASATKRNIALSAREWCATENLVVAITPSMFGRDMRSSISLMKTGGYINNPRLSKDNSVLVFDCRVDSLPGIQIVDRLCQDFDSLAPHYISQVQSIRMLSCEGENTWLKRNKPWSAALIGMNGEGHLLFIFVHQKTEMPSLVAALLELPLDLVRLQYGEGGSSAQLCVEHDVYSYYGCGLFELNGVAGDEGLNAPAVPNVLGIVRRIR